MRCSWCHVQPPSLTFHQVCYLAVQIRGLWIVLAQPASQLLWGDTCVDVHHCLCWHAWRASCQSLDNCQPSVHIILADVRIRCACFDGACLEKSQIITKLAPHGSAVNDAWCDGSAAHDAWCDFAKQGDMENNLSCCSCAWSSLPEAVWCQAWSSVGARCP